MARSGMLQQDTFDLEDPAEEEVFELVQEYLPPSRVREEDIVQFEFFLPEPEVEIDEPSPQLEFVNIPKPVHLIAVSGVADPVVFQHANSLLESLESAGMQIPYQCREGYCGSCRANLVEGEVAYLQEPMAWLNDGEVLLCCCVPKTDLSLKLNG